ncbi:MULTISPECIES: methyl-accepting chemotaxis protein [unclassified Nocardioides]|uniref:methyl-accepting chemotaxis protein n=1 Tax=unclassified Nocardioides TaxID=2615069 RepID=UPI003616FFCB
MLKNVLRRLDNVRIGVRLSAVFALCGLLVGSAYALDIKAQHDAAALEDQVEAAAVGEQIADDLLIAINDITGWQGLYIADAAAYGVAKGMGPEDYNVQGFASSQQGIEEMFGTMDRSMLTPDEDAIIAEVEKNFEQFFAEDLKLRAMLTEQGLDALPAVMDSINGGSAGEAWSATYDASARFRELIEARTAELLDQQEAELSAGRRNVLVAFGLAGIVALGLLVVVIRSITGPVRRMVDQLRLVATGRLDVRSDFQRGDEVGQMSAALDEALASISDSMRQVGTNADGLTEASQRLAGVSAQMSHAATDAAGQTDLVATAADQVSHNVQTVAAGTEEMSASIREIAHNATDAAGVAGRAVEAAEATTATVAKLGESSSEVGNVIKVINSIAEQTNLLALNATIEAARAGEAGKGFAVVANEVKELAQETARATEDISRRIEAIQADTGEAVVAIGEISEIIAQISDTQTTIASAVEEQTATTNEMSRNVNEAATGSRDIAQTITGVARATTESTAAATSTSEAADDLARMAADMQALVGRFTC